MFRIDHLLTLPYDVRITLKYVKNKGMKYNLGLDLGCNDGYKSLYHKKYIKFMIGIDIDISELRKAKNLLDGIIQASATILPFRSDMFDMVTCFHVIEHLKNPQDMLKEIDRVLEVEGENMVVTPNRRRINSRIYKNTLRLGEYDYPSNVDHVYEFTRGEIIDIFRMNTQLSMILFKPLGLFRIPNIGVVPCPKFLAKYADQFLFIYKKRTS